jgi:hypothetical protein
MQEVLDGDFQIQEPQKKIRKNLGMIIRYVIPLAVMAMLRITMKAENFNLDGGPDLYGFPMAFMSSTWVNSFEHEIYLTGFLVDLAFYGVLISFLLLPVIDYIKPKWLKNLVTFGLWGLLLTKLTPFIIFFEHLDFLWFCGHTTEYMEYSFHYGFIPF